MPALKWMEEQRVDGKGIVKFRWNEEVEEEQDKALGYIAQIANLLAPLRGTVYLSEFRYGSTDHFINIPAIIIVTVDNNNSSHIHNNNKYS